MSETHEFTASEIAAQLSSHIADKVVLLTGCSSGSLAASVARTISSHSPASLILAGRSRTALQETEKVILAGTPNVNVKLLILDLSNHTSIRKAAAEINSLSEKIDVLINSAGIMACAYEKTADGVERQFAVNHVGPFLLTNLVIDRLSRGGRVLNITSGAYIWGGVRYDDVNFEKEPYEKFQAYAQAKTANILFSQGIAERLSSRGIFSYSVTPGGVVPTNIGRYLTAEDIALIGSDPTIKIKDYDQGTATYVTAAFDPEVEAHNGSLLEFCKVRPIEDHCPWARGKDNVDKLWTLSEDLVGEKFSYV
ncbi:hypothetical protein BJ878DRAFT_562431 [Calycina marina]|uniref:Uncharacterized protein n=1 Tax=Calycina marina TaxID=1763456 RepID=A0A9P8CAN3_9HELO|nr:hypothetical protein BJ878DRAFT_562431 [Calycina marina]